MSGILLGLDGNFPFFSAIKTRIASFNFPLRSVVNDSYLGINWFKEFFTNKQLLIAQKHSLEIKVASLSTQAQKTADLETRNAQLTKLLNGKPAEIQDFLLADVVHAEGSPFANDLLINRGSKDGVYVGQPVLDSEGIVGQVISADPWQSTVLLVTAKEHAVPAMVAKNSLQGLAIGTARGYLILTGITNAEGLQVGDLVVSSGLGDKFPRGYPVGTITFIKHSKSKPFALIKVKPAAGALDKLQPLLLIRGRDANSVTAINPHAIDESNSAANQENKTAEPASKEAPTSKTNNKQRRSHS